MAMWTLMITLTGLKYLLVNFIVKKELGLTDDTIDEIEIEDK
ncbi:hypothetical protein [Microcystis sp. M113S1]|jgi:hypothetical protein|nr:hypothetical protein [Microcystis sp. M113S1]